MYTSRIDLTPATRKAATDLLQARLSDALDLAAQMKQAHWNVKGRDFLSHHELFDKLAGEALEFVDILAERITTLGAVADGRVQTTAKASTLYEYSLQTHSGDEHLRAAAAVLAQFAAVVRSDIARANDLDEADTADIFTEISRAVDKQLWLVESHLL